MIEITKDKETITQFANNYPRGLSRRVTASVRNIYIYTNIYIINDAHL